MRRARNKELKEIHASLGLDEDQVELIESEDIQTSLTNSSIPHLLAFALLIIFALTATIIIYLGELL